MLQIQRNIHSDRRNNHIWRMRLKKTTCKLQEKCNVLSGRKQRYRKVSVGTFLENPEEIISEGSTLSTISEDAISNEDISTQLIWSYSLCRNHTLKKTFYVTYLKDHFCRSLAGKWITLKKFSEDVFWRRFLRYQQYHATYSKARKEEYFKLHEYPCWNITQEKENILLYVSQRILPYLWYVQKLQMRKTISEHSIYVHSTLESSDKWKRLISNG